MTQEQQGRVTQLKWVVVVAVMAAYADGQAGGRLEKIIPEHSTVSLLQLLMMVKAAAAS